MDYLKKIFFISTIFFFVSTSSALASGKITFVYGNRKKANEACLRGWGFTILIEFDGKRVLFNTGGNAKVLDNNLKVLKVDPKTLDAIVISHEHWEYYTALGVILKANPLIPVYLTKNTYSYNFSDFKNNNFKIVNNDVVSITPKFLLMKIRSGRFQGGPFGIDEIHIILKTSEGLVIAEGCGHPQVLNVVKKSKAYTGEERVAMLMGGTWLHHRGTLYDIADSGERFRAMQMFNWSDDDYTKLAIDLKNEGVKWIIPTHCTGEPAETIFKNTFKEHYINELLGMSVKVPPTNSPVN